VVGPLSLLRLPWLLTALGPWSYPRIGKGMCTLWVPQEPFSAHFFCRALNSAAETLRCPLRTCHGNKQAAVLA
jgi:hypothetical protein